MPGLLENLGLRYGWPEEYPALGFDPAPGRVAQVEALATVFRNATKAFESIADGSEQAVASSGGWEADSGESFRDRARKFTKHARTAADALRPTSKALTDWADALTTMQSRARDYEKTAATAKAAADDAIGGMFFGIEAAQEQFDAAGDTLRQVKADARRLQGQHETAATAVATTLRDAVTAAPEASPLSTLFATVTLPGEQHTKSFLTRNANVIANFGDVLGNIGTFTGLTSLVLLGLTAAATTSGVGAPADVVLAPATVIVGGVSVVTGSGAFLLHALSKVNGGDVSGTDLLWDTFGVVTLGLGGTGKLVSGIEEVTTTTVSTVGQSDDTMSQWETYWEPKGSFQEKVVDLTKPVYMDVPARLLLFTFYNAADHGHVEYEQALIDALEKETK